MKHLKKAKRLIASIITMALIMSMMTITAFASTVTLTTSDTTNIDLNGHTYTVYQILSGTASSDGQSLENVAWGSNVTTDAQKSAIVTGISIASTEAAAFAAAIQSQSADSSTLQSLASTIYAQVSSTTAYKTTTVSTADTASIELTDVGTGYYLIVDSYSGSDSDYSVSRYILVQVTSDNVSVTLKDTVPTLTKQIWHNDSDDYTDSTSTSATGWSVVGDNQIGDTVWFQITVTVPDVTGYGSYTYKVTDTLSDGLTVDSSLSSNVRVTYGDDDEAVSSTYYSASSSENTDGTTTVTVDFTSFLTMVSTYSLSEGDEIHIYFSATLNDDANVSTGSTDVYESNSAYLTYSNDPNGSGTGTTAEVEVYDWTYQVSVLKTNSSSTALTGAYFVLSESSNLGTLSIDDNETIVDSNGDSVEGSLIKVVAGTSGTYTVADSTATSTVYSMQVDNSGNLYIKGLDDATNYYLYEVQAPTGYTQLTAPVEFKIVVTYESDGTTISSYTVSLAETSSDAEVDSSNVLTVVNTSSASLPGTGGAGTTMLYFFGTILVAGAVVLLVVKRTRSHAA